jgi:predicted RNA binding protein YcfA (HicA-like mRNA interferase family)
MVKLPVISGKRLIKVLQNEGFEVVRQKGSHVSLQKDNFRTVVPLHNELAKRNLSRNIKTMWNYKRKIS